MSGHRRDDYSLRHLATLDRSQCLSGSGKAKSGADHISPWNTFGIARGDVHCAIEVRKVRAPAPMNLEVLPVHLLMWLNKGRTGVRVLPAHNDTAAVSDEVERLRDGFRRAGCLDDDVRATFTGQLPHQREALRVRNLEVNDGGGAHAFGKVQSRRWCADRDDRI